jgi:NAD(P)-dependent dehydrogenase (short-subunit alcohol dehydrogenase family)
MSDPGSVRALFARTKTTFGRLDLLFNNAGTNAYRQVSGVSIPESLSRRHRRPALLVDERFANKYATGGSASNISTLQPGTGQRFSTREASHYGDPGTFR